VGAGHLAGERETKADADALGRLFDGGGDEGVEDDAADGGGDAGAVVLDASLETQAPTRPAQSEGMAGAGDEHRCPVCETATALRTRLAIARSHRAAS
jgi:hypothetical protein